MNSRARQDSLIRLLRRRGNATAGELARDLAVSRRTVLRDLAALRDQGFHLHADPGPGGGVHLDAASVQVTARPSVTEVFALLISVATMKTAGLLPFADLADSGLAKIERGLSAEKTRDLRRMLASLHVGTISPLQDLSDLGTIDPALLPAFEYAFLQMRHLRFQYRDAKGRDTAREVEPQAMLILHPLWYLVGWDPSRGDFRHFRMDRISAPEVVEDRAFRRRHVPFEADICPFREMEKRGKRRAD